MEKVEGANKGFLDMTGYQWLVLLAAWLAWGFDVFAALLFNYVAPNCIPTLLGLQIGSEEAKQAIPFWNGLLTSLLLIGWGIGGILMGRVCDRIGRAKTVLITMLLCGLGTVACAFVPNIYLLIVCRIFVSIGIGGVWAASAAMVAEVVPENRRVEAGALLYTAAPMGLFLATYVTYMVQGVAMKGSPESAWRTVFLFGLVPAVAAFFVRAFVKEPDKWKDLGSSASPQTVQELFSPTWRTITLSGLGMAVIALIAWWSCNAFIPQLATGLAAKAASAQGLAKEAATVLGEEWKKIATNSFNVGGLIGTLLTIPIAKHLGRKAMFGTYFVLAGLAIMAAFGLPLADEQRLYMCFFIGLSVFGVFGSFTYYLPELFPTRLRATGSGFTYNAGRFIAAAGPFLIGSVVAQGPDTIMKVLFWVGVVPILGLLLLPLVVETKGRELA